MVWERPIRVFVVDNHEFFRQGIITILERTDGIDVVGESISSEIALDMCRDLHPDVVLMDVHLPGCDGIALTTHLREQNPDVKVLALTISTLEKTFFEAMRAGASGYVLKDITPPALVEAIQRVYLGQPVLPDHFVMTMITDYLEHGHRPGPSPESRLTKRQLDVLRHLGVGAKDSEIARALSVSENTVRHHIHNILVKLGFQNRVQAATYAVREGYVNEALPHDGPS